MTESSNTPAPEQQPAPPTSQPTTPPEAKPGKRSSKSTAPAADPLRGSRTSGVWVALIAIAALLILLLIFIVQNTQDVQVAFLGWEGRAPLAVSLLAAAVTGMVIVIVAASLRMLQVRRRVKRERR
ncbi:LapA family protein [Nocardioides ochotonae]|uniref:LapA family protein n=1 Tax=Nocardioides ochotonae TaxID=2685869 RepID=UPI0014093974|nr:lipopolysaccharide assembly protein LapA domain-containing protein [Nocardioides ochotonae]